MARPKPKRKSAPQKARKPSPAKKAPTAAALAKRPWKSLRKAEKDRLRSVRAKRGWRTRLEREYGELATRLSGHDGPEERGAAREELRSEGTAGIAKWLKREKRLTPKQIREVFAFWYYAP